jgi:hypothetical protein
MPLGIEKCKILSIAKGKIEMKIPQQRMRTPWKP